MRTKQPAHRKLLTTNMEFGQEIFEYAAGFIPIDGMALVDSYSSGLLVENMLNSASTEMVYRSASTDTPGIDTNDTDAAIMDAASIDTGADILSMDAASIDTVNTYINNDINVKLGIDKLIALFTVGNVLYSDTKVNKIIDWIHTIPTCRLYDEMSNGGVHDAPETPHLRFQYNLRTVQDAIGRERVTAIERSFKHMYPMTPIVVQSTHGNENKLKIWEFRPKLAVKNAIADMRNIRRRKARINPDAVVRPKDRKRTVYSRQFVNEKSDDRPDEINVCSIFMHDYSRIFKHVKK